MCWRRRKHFGFKKGFAFTNALHPCQAGLGGEIPPLGSALCLFTLFGEATTAIFLFVSTKQYKEDTMHKTKDLIFPADGKE